MFMLVMFCIAFDNLTKDDTIFFQLYHICLKIFGLIQYQTRIPPTGALYVQSQNKESNEIHKQIFKKGYNSVRKGRIRNPAFAHNYVLWVTILEPFKIIHKTL